MFGAIKALFKWIGSLFKREPEQKPVNPYLKPGHGNAIVQRRAIPPILIAKIEAPQIQIKQILHKAPVITITPPANAPYFMHKNVVNPSYLNPYRFLNTWESFASKRGPFKYIGPKTTVNLKGRTNYQEIIVKDNWCGGQLSIYNLKNRI